jgi:hypothetical protein
LFYFQLKLAVTNLADSLLELADDGGEGRHAHVGAGHAVLVSIAEALRGGEQQRGTRHVLTSAGLKKEKKIQ